MCGCAGARRLAATETDGGAVGRGYIAISYLTAISAEEDPDLSATTDALDRLLKG